MKKLTRVVLYFFGAIIAFCAVLLLAVNLYVQSQGTQARIEKELGQRLGTTLRIQRISVTPWWGLKLRGITIPQTDTGIGGDFLQADTFRLRIRFLSLFARELVIKEVALVHPTVVWAQNKDGKWRIPSSARAEPQAQSSEPATVPAQTNVVPPNSDTATESTAPEPSSTTFKPEVRRVSVTNGDFRFLDAKRRPVAAFEGIKFRSNFRSSTELNGNVSIAKISLRDRFFLENLASPLRYDPDVLEFSAINANAAGGEVSGEFSMQPTQPGSPFVAKVSFRNLQTDKLVSDAGGPRGMLQGRLEGELEATGSTADPDALAGGGEIYLRDGQLRQYSLLIALGQLLQIDELSQLHFEQAHVKYHITPGVVMVDELLLNSQNIRVAAHGTVNFDGKLRLDAQLAINDRIKSQLFQAMQANFHPTDEPQFAAIDFNVGGTVEKPKTNLMKKLVGNEMKDLGGIISGLLRGAKQKRPEPSPAAVDAAPQATPEAQPTNTP